MDSTIEVSIVPPLAGFQDRCITVPIWAPPYRPPAPINSSIFCSNRHLGRIRGTEEYLIESYRERHGELMVEFLDFAPII